MLTQLMPDQIAAHWGTLKFAIEESLPPIAENRSDRMNNIFKALLAGSMDCFVQYKADDDKISMTGIVITQFTHDLASGTKNLMVYCLYNFKPMSDHDWLENLIVIKRYAENSKCHRIVAYTKDLRMLDLARKFQADSSYTFVTIPVGG